MLRVCAQHSDKYIHIVIYTASIKYNLRTIRHRPPLRNKNKEATYPHITITNMIYLIIER